jgi:hypothetical protein
MVRGGTGIATLAIIAVGFAVATAYGAVFPRAEWPNFDAQAGPIRRAALSRLGIAPKTHLALNAGNPLAEFAEAGARAFGRYKRAGACDEEKEEASGGHDHPWHLFGQRHTGRGESRRLARLNLLQIEPLDGLVEELIEI